MSWEKSSANLRDKHGYIHWNIYSFVYSWKKNLENLTKLMWAVTDLHIEVSVWPRRRCAGRSWRAVRRSCGRRCCRSSTRPLTTSRRWCTTWRRAASATWRAPSAAAPPASSTCTWCCCRCSPPCSTTSASTTSERTCSVSRRWQRWINNVADVANAQGPALIGAPRL